jgi:HEAT repeat protein
MYKYFEEKLKAIERKESSSESENQRSPNLQTDLFEKRNEIKRYIKELFSDNDIAIFESINELARFGKEAVPLLVEELLKKSLPLEVRENIARALIEIGKPSVEPLLAALEALEGIKDPEELYLLEDLAKILTTLKEKRAEVLLVKHLSSLASLIERNENKVLLDICEAVKIRIHQMLCELGSKDGLEDLLYMLGDGRKRVREGVVESITKIGDRRALLPLLRLYEMELSFSDSGARAIKHAFREIIRREGVNLEDPIFKDLQQRERETLERLYPKHKTNGQSSNQQKISSL